MTTMRKLRVATHRNLRPITKPPTKRQVQVLGTVHWMLLLGDGVTVRSLGARLGMTSTNAVTEHLEALRRRGLVTWERGKAHTLQVTETGKALVGTVRCERVTDEKMLRALKRLLNWAPGVVDKVPSGKRRRT